MWASEITNNYATLFLFNSVFLPVDSFKEMKMSDYA
jgi:hypothetical protein